MNCRTPYSNKIKRSLFVKPPHGGAFTQMFLISKGRFFMSRSAKCDEGEEYVRAEQRNLWQARVSHRRFTHRSQVELSQLLGKNCLDPISQRISGWVQYNSQDISFNGEADDKVCEFLERYQGVERDRLAKDRETRRIPPDTQRVQTQGTTRILHLQRNEGVVGGIGVDCIMVINMIVKQAQIISTKIAIFLALTIKMISS